MVQERTWVDHKQISVNMVPETIINEESCVDSDSSEELQYGPGIVSKLKNRLRLHMRKAGYHPIEEENNHKFRSNQLFESAENKYTSHVNRPKGPAPVVKQMKKFFETRPERPTKPPLHTGDVAAKVANFKSIITKAFTNPTLKQKPQVDKRKPPPPDRLPITRRRWFPQQADLEDQQNCIVFKFTGRKDVPDFVGNDGTIRTGKIEKPKTGEGGITILPGASMTFVDYDQEQRSLVGPMSPCDVSFINDNILINGRSNLSQKTKKPKMRIRFVEAVPQIFVYPSEASMLLEQQDVQSPTTIGTMGHTVPSLTGTSSMTTYTPRWRHTFYCKYIENE